MSNEEKSKSGIGTWIIRGAILAAMVRMNDFDPPAPPALPDKPDATQTFMGVVYSRTIFGNVGRVKEAYFPSPESCSKYVASNLRESEGVVDLNAFDSGKCYTATPETSAAVADPQVATINLRNWLGNYQFNQNIKTRYFGSVADCQDYVTDTLKQMAGVLDVNMWDSATCHSTKSGLKTVHAENSLLSGISSVRSGPAVDMPESQPEAVLGSYYLRNIFGNLSREKNVYFQSVGACEAYMSDALKESEHPLDLNALDGATCTPSSGKGQVWSAANSLSGGITSRRHEFGL